MGPLFVIMTRAQTKLLNPSLYPDPEPPDQTPIAPSKPLETEEYLGEETQEPEIVPPDKSLYLKEIYKYLMIQSYLAFPIKNI